MAPPPEKIVSDIGKQLAKESRPSKDFIVKSLQQAVSALSQLEQLSTLKDALKPLSKSLAGNRLLRHKDKDVRLLVAICFCEVMRILAPDPSFDDKTYKEIFNLFITMFVELGNVNSPSFTKTVKILETVDALDCCLHMLDIGCDDLILKMFCTFFSVVRNKHPQSLVNGMLSIMALILDEGEISQQLLEVILQNLRNQGEGTLASYQLAVKLIERCSERMKPAVCKFITCCILDRNDTQSDLKGCYHEIIFEISKCTPQMMTDIIPSIIQELLTDQVDSRIKSINLIGKLLLLPKTPYTQEHYQLLHLLLDRLSDKVAEVRINAVCSVKACYKANPLAPESREILSSLESRLLDFDVNVRTEALAALCDLALFRLKIFPLELLVPIMERLRDKMASVRKEALKKCLMVYHHYCSLCSEGQMTLNEVFEQIPCKIMMLYCDKNLKEFRPENLELLVAEDLFPVSLSVKDRTRHWISLHSLFTNAQMKAFNFMLWQKRRRTLQMKLQAE